MKNEIKGKNPKRYKLYLLSILVAVVMAVSCVAIFATDEQDVAADPEALHVSEFNVADYTYGGSCTPAVAMNAVGGTVSFYYSTNGSYTIINDVKDNATPFVASTVPAGSYYMYLVEEGATNEVYDGTARTYSQFVVSPADSEITTVPSGAAAQDYNGSAKNLIGNSPAVTGGALWYAVMLTSAAPADAEAFATAVTGFTWTETATATDAGAYTVFYKVVGDANHNDIVPDFEAKFTATINKVDFSGSVSMSGYDYGTDSQSPTVVTDATATTLYYAVSGTYATISDIKTGGTEFTASESVNAGTYYMYLVCENDVNFNDGFAVSASTFTVEKIAYPGSLTMDGYTYGVTEGVGAYAAPSLSVDPVGGTPTYYWTTADEFSDSNVYEPGSATTLNAGNYYLWVKITEMTNYNAVTSAIRSGQFTVAQAASSITITASQTFPYDGSAPTIATTGKVGTGDVSFTYYTAATEGEVISPAPVNAGTYWVTAMVAADANHTEFTTGRVSYTINKVDYPGSLTMNGYTYGLTEGVGAYAVPSLSVEPVGGTPTYYWTTTDEFSDSNVYEPGSATTLNAGNYYLWVKITEMTNYNAVTSAIRSGQFTVDKAASSISVTASQTFPYDGSAPTIAVTKTGDGAVTFTHYTAATEGEVISPAPVNAGTYYVVATMAEGTNYLGSNSGGRVAYTINKVDYPGSLTMDGYTYGATAGPGAYTAPSLSVDPVGGTPTYYWTTLNEFSDSNVYSTQTATALNAGNYYLWVKITEMTNYNAVTTAICSGMFTVSKGTSSISIDALQSFPYDGNAPTIAVTKTGDGLVTFTYYTAATEGQVISPAPVNAGTYYVVATMDEGTNYLGSNSGARVAYTITKIPSAIVITPSQEFPYNGGAPTIATTGQVGTGNVSFLYYAAEVGGVAIDAPIDAGTYWVTATVAEDANHTEFTTDRVAYTINKVAYPGSLLMNGYTYGVTEGPGAYTAPSLSVDPVGGTPTYYWTTVNEFSDSNVYSTQTATAFNAGSYYLWVKITEMTNYNAVTTAIGSGQIVVDKASITITPSIADWTYGASASTPSVTGNTGGGAVTYEYKVRDAGDNTYTEEVPTAVGLYTMRATVAETTNYESGVGTVNFQITKAVIAVPTPVPEVKAYTGGSQSSSLVAGEGYTVSSQATGTIVGMYQATLTLTDTANTKWATTEEAEVYVNALSITQAIVEWPAIASKVYTGSPQTATIPSSAYYTVTANAGGTNVGTYSVTLTLKDADNYKWADVDTDYKTVADAFAITEAIVEWPTIEHKAYTGSPQTATVPDSDLYSVTANDGGTAVGSYSVTLTLTDSANYKWADVDTAAKVVADAFTIDRAAFSATVSMESYVEGTQYVVPTVNTIAAASLRYYATVNSLDSISVIQSSATLFTLSEDVAAGTYYMYVIVKDDTNMVDGFAVSATSFVVSLPPAVITTAPSGADAQDYSDSAKNLIGNSPAATGGTLWYAVMLTSTAPADAEAFATAVSGFTWTETATAVNAGAYTVFYKVIGDANHSDVAPAFASKFTATINKIDSSIEIVPNQSFPQTASAPDIATTNKIGDGAVSFTYYAAAIGGDPLASAPIVEGTYYVIATVAESTNYNAYTTPERMQYTITEPVIEMFHGFIYANYDGATPVDVSQDVPKGMDIELWDEDEFAQDILSLTGWAVAHKVITGFNTKADGTGTTYIFGATIPATTVAALADADDNVKLYLVWSDAPAATVTTAPAAIANLVYSGEAQALVTAGVASGGTMQYSLKSGADYSATIPTKIPAGTYTVYYKAVGDAEHSDSDEASVQVTIAKFTPTVTIVNKDDGVCSATNNDIGPASVQLVGGEVFSGTVTYTYYTDPECTSDASTSAPSFVGTYYVKATIAASDNYNAAASNVATLLVKHVLTPVAKSGSVAAHYDCDKCQKHFLDEAGTVEYIIPAGEQGDTIVNIDAAVDPTDSSKAKADATATIAAVDTIKDADPNAKIVAEISVESTGVTTVSVDATQVKSLAEKGADVKVGTVTSSAEFTAETLKGLTLTSGDFAFGAKTVAVPEKYKDKIGTNAVAVDVNLTVGTTAVKQFGDKVKVSFSYVLPLGADASKLKVWYVGGDTLEEFECTYDEETQTVTFETTHFSEFAVGVDNSSPAKETRNQGLLLMILLVAAIILPIIAALVIYREK